VHPAETQPAGLTDSTTTDRSICAQLAEAARNYHTSTVVALEARKRLYRLVCAGNEGGLPQATLARLAGLTRTRIHQIILANRKE